jgi:hypothetical protein
MSRKKSKSKGFDLDEDLPAWVDDKVPMRTTPYTEEELDLFVEDTLERICDTAAWLNLVDRVGEEEARRELRARIVMRDENTRKLTRH